MTEPDHEGRPGARAWFATLSLKQMLIALAVIVVLLSGVFGGLDRADEDTQKVPRLRIGQLRHAAPVDVVVRDVRLQGGALTVRSTIRQTTDESLFQGTVADVIRVRGLETPPQVIVTTDRQPLTTAVPGLGYSVWFVWPKWRGPTDEVRLETRDLTHRKSSIDEQLLWTDPRVDAVGRFRL